MVIFISLRAYGQDTNKIDNTGNVGIGVTNPSYPLHISRDGGTSAPFATLYVNSTINHGGIVINSPSNKQSHLRFSEDGTLRWQFRVPNQESPDFRLYSWGAASDIMTWQYNTGNVGIGVSDPDSKLVVDGKIRSEEVKVEIINAPDFVFDSDYKLRTLEEIKEFITENKHLPEIPPAIEMEDNGIELGEMNMRLLKKIEELTLYQIELLGKLKQLESKMRRFETK